MGQTRKSGRPPGMSVAPPIADIARLHAQVRSVPNCDIAEALTEKAAPALTKPFSQRGENSPETEIGSDRHRLGFDHVEHHQRPGLLFHNRTGLEAQMRPRSSAHGAVGSCIAGRPPW
jgi:hypothetical protein